jgi:hypothetical protein
MGKRLLTTIAVLPLLLGMAPAAQRWTVDSSQPFGIPIDDSDTSSYLGVEYLHRAFEHFEAEGRTRR